MKLLNESEIFKFNNKNNDVSAKMASIANSKDITIVNGELQNQIDNLKKIFKDPQVVKMVSAINKGDIILFYTDSSKKLPNYIPFIKYKINGNAKVAVDLTTDLIVYTDKDTGDKAYNIDLKKLLCLTMPAFIALNIYDKTTTLPSVALEIAAKTWSKMFNKVLERNIALNTNRERYEAFIYFGMKFFLINMAEVPIKVAENIAESYLKNGKSYTINMCEEYVSNSTDINMYESIFTLCKVLFNNEATGIRGIRNNNVNQTMNIGFYIQRFVQMYDKRALLALDQIPYFIFVIFASQNNAFLVADRSFEDLIMDKEYFKMMNSLYTML